MGDTAVQLTLRIEEKDADPERRAELADGLRRELLELDVDEVSWARTAAPPTGAKSASAFTLGTLLVVLAHPELLAAVVTAVEAWVAGRAKRSVRLEIDGDVIEVTGLSAKERRQLIDEWLGRRQDGRSGHERES